MSIAWHSPGHPARRRRELPLWDFGRRSRPPEDGGLALVQRLVAQDGELSRARQELTEAKTRLAAVTAQLEEAQARAARASMIAEMNWDSPACRSIHSALTPPRRPSPRPRAAIPGAPPS